MPGLISLDRTLIVVLEIALLADRDDDAALVADDAAVAGRVGDLARRDRERRVARLLVLDDEAEVRRFDEGHVAVEHHHDGVRAVLAERRDADARRVPGPALRLLDDRAHARIERFLQVLLHEIAPMADHDDHVVAPRVERRAHGIVQERPSGDGVKDLRERALHALPQSGGENDRGLRGHGRTRATR